MTEAIGLLLALVVGALLGLLGGGGSILAVPVFVYVLGLDPKLAIAASLGVVGTTSLIGAWRQWREGNLEFGTAMLFAAGSAVASFLGAKSLSQMVSGTVQMVIFGVVMLVAAMFMFRGRRTPPSPESGNRRSVMQIVLVVLPAIFVGVLTGLIGVGGGFMIVPSLVLLAGVAMKPAVGTSLLVIAINSAMGFAGYMMQDDIRAAFDTASVGSIALPPYLAMFTALTIIGVIAGTALGKRIHPEHLRRYFALFLIAMAVFILLQNLVL